MKFAVREQQKITSWSVSKIQNDNPVLDLCGLKPRLQFSHKSQNNCCCCWPPILAHQDTWVAADLISMKDMFTFLMLLSWKYLHPWQPDTRTTALKATFLLNTTLVYTRDSYCHLNTKNICPFFILIEQYLCTAWARPLAHSVSLNF